jgi:hypothetical protein
MADKLNMDLINSLPQPFFTEDGWMVESICVETGLMKIDVMGKLDNSHISEHWKLRDIDGTEYDTEDWYVVSK